jgi:hypothetical protein
MEREVTYGSGKQGLRYAAKVDLSTPAAEQDCLHVSRDNPVQLHVQVS